MKKDIVRKIEIPQEMSAKIDGSKMEIKGNGKEIKKIFPQSPKVIIEIKNNEILITSKNATKRELKLINSLVAHIKNMIDGINKDFIYKLEVCNVHFPVSIKIEGKMVKIKNFLGEKIDRTAEMLDNVKISNHGSIIEISSPDIESAGQSAARLEYATKIKNRDRRVFQDGVFIVEKPGRREAK